MDQYCTNIHLNIFIYLYRYNNTDIKDLYWQRYRSFVGQLDREYAVLTVKEILDYANKCSNGTVYKNYSSNLKVSISRFI